MRTAHTLRGVALFVLCLFLFACLDTTTKYLAQSYPAPLIVATRYAVNLLLMVAILAPRHSQQIFPSETPDPRRHAVALPSTSLQTFRCARLLP